MWPLGSRAALCGPPAAGMLRTALPVGVVFAHDLLAVMRHEVMAVRQPARVAHVEMAAVLAFGQQANFLGDAARRLDLQQPSAVALADERVAVGQPLAGVDLALGLVVEHDLLVARDFLHAVAGVEQQVAVGQHPQVVAARGLVFPLDFARRATR